MSNLALPSNVRNLLNATPPDNHRNLSDLPLMYLRPALFAKLQQLRVLCVEGSAQIPQRRVVACLFQSPSMAHKLTKTLQVPAADARVRDGLQVVCAARQLGGPVRREGQRADTYTPYTLQSHSHEAKSSLPNFSHFLFYRDLSEMDLYLYSEESLFTPLENLQRLYVGDGCSRLWDVL